MPTFKWPPQGSGTVGTVTSVGLADGSIVPIYTISGSPVTAAGTLTFSLIPQLAHALLIGPTSGAAAQPTFRLLTAADLPVGTGTVTSVGLADGSTTPIFAITNSPVTTSGVLTFSLLPEVANTILAGPPTAPNAQPTFRVLVPADLPAGLSTTVTNVSNNAPYFPTLITATTTGNYPLNVASGFAFNPSIPALGINNNAPTHVLDILLPATNGVFIDGSTNIRTVTDGILSINLTAGDSSTRAIQLNVASNAFADTHGMNIDWSSGALTVPSENSAIHVNVDGTNAVNGILNSLEVQVPVLGGLLSVNAVRAGPGVNVVSQHTGAFAVSDQAWSFATAGSIFTSVTTGSHTLFGAASDILYVGKTSSVFSSVVIVISTGANSTILPRFQYWNGSAWSVFIPSDGTAGFIKTGNISFTASSLTGWASTTVNGVAAFYIRVIRIAGASVTTPPVESAIQLTTGSLFRWTAAGDINANSVTATTQLISQVATGTPPLVVASTTLVPNLNVATSGTSNLATNLAGGLGGSIPYQTAVNTTAMLANGTAGQLLTSNGGTTAPSWTNSAGNLTADTFSGNGATVAFTLSVSPGSLNNTAVYISGVYQQKATYSLSGTTLTFTTAPPTGTNNVEVISGSALSIGTPANGTVTGASFAAQVANTALMGPTSGGSATPGFRAIVGTDLGGQGTIHTGTFQTLASSSTSTIYSYTVLGGGGAGGNSNATGGAAGGGGGGGLAIGTFTGVAPLTTITVVTGIGGVIGGTGATGGQGGTSSIASPVSVTCTGGFGGVGVSTAVLGLGGAGGTVSGGSPTIALTGSSGGGGGSVIAGDSGGGGNGAGTMYGSGGVRAGGSGTTAIALGSGGGGANLVTASGGNGASGVVIITQLTP